MTGLFEPEIMSTQKLSDSKEFSILSGKLFEAHKRIQELEDENFKLKNKPVISHEQKQIAHLEMRIRDLGKQLFDLQRKLMDLSKIQISPSEILETI